MLIFLFRLILDTTKNDTPMQLLNKISRILRSAYPLTPISVTPPCITVKLSYCHLEGSPCNWFTDNEELFQNTTENGGMATDIVQKSLLNGYREENKQAGGLFKPTVKMLKRWRDVHKFHCGHFT